MREANMPCERGAFTVRRCRGLASLLNSLDENLLLLSLSIISLLVYLFVWTRTCLGPRRTRRRRVWVTRPDRLTGARLCDQSDEPSAPGPLRTSASWPPGSPRGERGLLLLLLLLPLLLLLLLLLIWDSDDMEAHACGIPADTPVSPRRSSRSTEGPDGFGTCI